MLSVVLAELLAVASLSPLPIVMAQAPATVEPPKTRRVCQDVRVPYSRMTRRTCTIVQVKQPAPDPAEVAAAEAAAVAPPAPVATTFEVGLPVVDAQGGTVGTISSVEADSVTVKTDKHEAKLPKTSFTLSEGKALIGVTQAELNLSVEKVLAETPAPR